MGRHLLRSTLGNVWPVYVYPHRLPVFRWMDPGETHRVWRRGLRRAFHDKRWRALVAVEVGSDVEMVLGLFLPLRVIVREVRGALRGQPISPHLPLGCDVLLCLLPISFLASFVCFQLRIRLVYRYVLGGHPYLCRACGYDLTTTPERCPECGVRPTEPARAASDRADTARL